MMKNAGMAVAALFIVTCFFDNMALAERKVAAEKQLSGQAMAKDKAGKRAEGKKKKLNVHAQQKSQTCSNGQ
ncbi:MAG: hypothetical protein ABFD45_12370 [Smithella sp.]